MMRSRRTLALVVLGALTLAPLSGVANHGPDGVYMQQAGDGGGNSGPIIRDFAMTAPLFNNSRFPVCGSGRCVERPAFPKYVGWGVVNFEFEGQQFLRVAMVKGSDDGLRWGAPLEASIQKPSGEMPFVLGLTSTNFDVMYNGTPTTQGNAPNYPFSIYYKLAPVSNGSSVDSIHVADSEDGINWVNDRPITQSATLPLVGAPGGTSFTYGPADITFQPTASSAADCAGAAGTTPWNCRYVMLYSRFDGGTQRSGLAGSGDGTNFAAYPGAIFAPTGATWDQSFVGLESVRVRVVAGVKQYLMAYTGGSGGTCASFGCFSIGTASSSNGINWTKNPGPMVPRALPNAVAEPGNFDTILNAEFVDDSSGSGHSKVFFTRYENAPYPRRMDTFLAQTADAPGAGPSITVASPANGFRTGAPTEGVIYVNDTNGTLVGEDLGTLAIDVDGIPVGGATFERTVVTSYKNVGTKIKIPASQLALADGAHVFTISVADRDGNVSTASTSFTVDTAAPSSLVTASPAGPVVGLAGLGTFAATSNENAGGIGMGRVRASVRNPLGMVKTWESSAPYGFNVNKVSANTWTWNWVAPTLDAHFAAPGEYFVTLSGIDLGGAYEKASAANTVSVLAL